MPTKKNHRQVCEIGRGPDKVPTGLKRHTVPSRKNFLESRPSSNTHEVGCISVLQRGGNGSRRWKALCLSQAAQHTSRGVKTSTTKLPRPIPPLSTSLKFKGQFRTAKRKYDFFKDSINSVGFFYKLQTASWMRASWCRVGRNI